MSHTTSDYTEMLEEVYPEYKKLRDLYQYYKKRRDISEKVITEQAMLGYILAYRNKSQRYTKLYYIHLRMFTNYNIVIAGLVRDMKEIEVFRGIYYRYVANQD